MKKFLLWCGTIGLALSLAACGMMEDPTQATATQGQLTPCQKDGKNKCGVIAKGMVITGQPSIIVVDGRRLLCKCQGTLGGGPLNNGGNCYWTNGNPTPNLPDGPILCTGSCNNSYCVVQQLPLGGGGPSGGGN